MINRLRPLDGYILKQLSHFTEDEINKSKTVQDTNIKRYPTQISHFDISHYWPSRTEIPFSISRSKSCCSQKLMLEVVYRP